MFPGHTQEPGQNIPLPTVSSFVQGLEPDSPNLDRETLYGDREIPVAPNPAPFGPKTGPEGDPVAELAEALKRLGPSERERLRRLLGDL